MKNLIKAFLLLLLITQLSSTLNAQRKQEFSKTFDAKDRVKLTSVLGDCKIVKSPDGKIHVDIQYTYDPEIYEISFNERDKSLEIEEDFDDNNPRGYSKWDIALPDGVELRVKSATGNIKIDGIDVDVDGNSGTGNVDVRNCSGVFELNSGTGNVYILESKGEFELNSGTGNVELQTVAGRFDLNSGTGDVDANDITFNERSKANSGTGDVLIKLAASPKDDLELNSGTGDSELDMNGIELNGYFELSCNDSGGDVKCPVDADREKIRRHHGHDLLVYSFTKGEGSINIKISTGSGTAELSL